MKPDMQDIRSQFPILNKEINGKKLVYFDNGATTQKPLCVIDAEASYYKEFNSNVHRGVHFLSTQSTIAFENARNTVRKFINATSDNEIIFTKGTTESVNLVAQSFSSMLSKGDNIIVSRMEHHSNIVPWQMACQMHGLELRVAEITSNGLLDLQQLSSVIDDRTKLISITHISNVLGTINPIKEIVDLAHKSNIAVMIDGAQSIAHLNIDVQKLDCDFFAFSAHKMYGPMGIGVLYGKEKWLEKMPPYQGGGEMIKNVSFEGTTFNELPFKFEAGTPNVAGAIALAEATRFINETGIKKMGEWEHELTNYALGKLTDMGDVIFFGPVQNRSAVISFLLKNIHPYDAGTLLDKMGIALRTGTHCAEPLMKFFGINGTMRISFAAYNTIEEIDYFLESLHKVKQIFE
ncbi:MAG: cysteine desulfurase CsdA [Bacteroidetes bacterium HGW-Bacteroidetes-6]|jgi:cysteine desulfurase/selenocysteine lyase|nr:MAG: cysteine desulfurase CsdA [Bacteroidetes bacterium HGW-Bacteroidetes-6]